MATLYNILETVRITPVGPGEYLTRCVRPATPEELAAIAADETVTTRITLCGYCCVRGLGGRIMATTLAVCPPVDSYRR